MSRTRFGAGLLVAVIAVACAGGSRPTSSVGLSVVTTTTVFRDFVKEVGGNRVSVRSLVPAGADVHTFDPAPSDALAVSAAQLVVMNGLGLDDWLERVVRDAGAANTALLKVGESVPGAEYISAPEDEGGAKNPHLWMDVTHARGYASLIASQLIQLDPAGKSTYDANLAAYDAELRELDTWIRGQLGPIPPDNRRIVSFHDAFPYFARAYGLEIVGVVVPAPGQDPSAGELAALIDAIRAAHVSAVLSEVQFDDRLLRQIATETGVAVVQDLYDDSVGDPPVDSYDAVMRWDTAQLV